MSTVCPSFTSATYDDQPAVMVSFTTESGKFIRTTREYSLIYVPATNEWFGDVIAPDGWYDLDADEIKQLRSYYGLDEFTQLYLPFLN